MDAISGDSPNNWGHHVEDHIKGLPSIKTSVLSEFSRRICLHRASYLDQAAVELLLELDNVALHAEEYLGFNRIAIKMKAKRGDQICQGSNIYIIKREGQRADP